MLKKETIDVINAGVYLLDSKVNEAWMKMKSAVDPKDYDVANAYFTEYLKNLHQFSSKIKFTGERSDLDRFTASDVLIFTDIEKVVARNDELHMSLLSSIIKDLTIFDNIYSGTAQSKVALQEVREYIRTNLAPISS
ncbi:hypothetical protein [Serratia sp. Se-RSBMAAmG]|uniref:hypothetical protein n=1 Tax=Serratia sp. Se-RSBMAAmG TaxID=3043305 RepID=UPI0024AFD35D|nr:hypothetical protein [Serratia sp. Se-RSBMAAmG]MDI6976245.1 hypothetical protein [Serratia sp. Se-RSBMAAmG]